MQDDGPSDPLLDGIRSAIRHYHRGWITAAELINGVFLRLGHDERYNLVDEVTRLIPESVRGELHRHVEAVLQPEAAYAPFMIGGPRDPEAWRQRMVPACRRLATLFRERLEAGPPGPGSTAV